MQKTLFHFDRGLLVALFFLLGTSLLTLFGIGVRDSSYTLAIRQSMWIVIGLGAFLVMSVVDYRSFRGARSFIILFYIFGAALLVGVLLFGIKVRGSASWFRIGSISLEPVEFTKIIFIIVMAQYFSLRHIESYRIRHILVSGLYAGLYSLLILMQPDMGSAVVLAGVWLGTVLISGAKIKQFLSLLLLGILLFAIGWLFYFADYQKERFISFIRPGYDPQGAGYNVRQAFVAIGSGGWFGKGIAEGTQVQLRFLPEAETDFIFAAIGEYFGLLGMLLIIFGIGYVLIWCLMTASKAKNNFARLISLGVFLLILVQSSIHIGMNLGMFPVTGVPLPFVSYGGSSLMSIFIGIGIVQGIAIRNKLGYPQGEVETL